MRCLRRVRHVVGGTDGSLCWWQVTWEKPGGKKKKPPPAPRGSAVPVKISGNTPRGAPSSALPGGWTEHCDDEGNTYYVNDITNETQWERPALSGHL